MWCHLEKFGRRLIISLMTSLLPWIAIGHPKTWMHVDEMYSVLPFATYKNGNVVEENFRIREMLETISKDLIDDYNRIKIKEYGDLTFYDYLKYKFDFKLGVGNHRLLFHWGYNAEPWNDELEDYVKREEWGEEKIKRFKDALKEEQKRRNAIANKSAEKVFGFASGGREAKWANSIMAIVYDVHLLGDYTEGDNKFFIGVTKPSKVAGDIINSIRNIDNSRTSRNIIDSIRKTTREYSNQEHVLASKLIEILQTDLPGFLLTANEGALKRKFEQKGFKLDGRKHFTKVSPG